MKKLPKHAEPVSREVVERIADILGPSAAATGALLDLERRLADGENAAIFLVRGGGWIVGPAPIATAAITD